MLNRELADMWAFFLNGRSRSRKEAKVRAGPLLKFYTECQYKMRTGWGGAHGWTRDTPCCLAMKIWIVTILEGGECV